MKGFMLALFCWVPIWTPLVRYVSCVTRRSSACCTSVSTTLSPDVFLDADELVELGDPLAPDRAALDRVRAERDRQVRDRLVRRLPAPVRHHRAVARRLGERDGLREVGEGADLIRLCKGCGGGGAVREHRFRRGGMLREAEEFLDVRSADRVASAADHVSEGEGERESAAKVREQGPAL